MLLHEGKEREIVRMVALGYTHKEIADQFFVAPITIRKIIERIKKRNNAKNRTCLAVMYAKEYKDV